MQLHKHADRKMYTCTMFASIIPYNSINITFTWYLCTNVYYMAKLILEKNSFCSSGVVYTQMDTVYLSSTASFFLLLYYTYIHTHGHAHIHTHIHSQTHSHSKNIQARARTHIHIHDRNQPTIYRLESWTRLVRSRSNVKQFILKKTYPLSTWRNIRLDSVDNFALHCCCKKKLASRLDARDHNNYIWYLLVHARYKKSRPNRDWRLWTIQYGHYVR